MRAPPPANSRSGNGGASSSSTGSPGHHHHHHHHHRRQQPTEGAQLLLGSFVVPEDNEPIGLYILGSIGQDVLENSFPIKAFLVAINHE